MKVEVVRSPKRRKTVQVRQVGDTLRVSIPASMSTAEEDRWVAEMVKRMERKASTARFDLTKRAVSLANRYDLEKPDSISWVENQEWRWGSCTPADRSIRISSRLGREPAWVIDYVIVHELSHLTVRSHNKAFWDLVNRYPLTERARGFLIARSADSEDDSDDPGDSTDPVASEGPIDRVEVSDPIEHEIEPGVSVNWASEPGRYRKSPARHRPYQPERLFA